MKIDTVLTACNLNSYYLSFVPLFIKSWQKMMPGIEVKVILIAETIPDHLIAYKDSVILFHPITHVSTAFISQYIRILYPALIETEGAVLISDVDMFPMNKRYYTDNIASVPDNHFIYFRDVLLQEKEIAICYNAASPDTWGEIFDIESLGDVRTRLTRIGRSMAYANVHGGTGWNKDQRDLYEYVMKWNGKTDRFTSLQDTDTGFLRLDGKYLSYKHTIRDLSKEVMIMIRAVRGKYSDFHAQGPNDEFRAFNHRIIQLTR